jgi:hypothetical protein
VAAGAVLDKIAAKMLLQVVQVVAGHIIKPQEQQEIAVHIHHQRVIMAVMDYLLIRISVAVVAVVLVVLEAHLLQQLAALVVLAVLVIFLVHLLLMLVAVEAEVKAQLLLELLELVAVAQADNKMARVLMFLDLQAVQLILVEAEAEMERAMLPMFLEQAAQELSSSNTQ